MARPLTRKSRLKAMDRCVEALRDGMTVGLAARYAGVVESTLYDWRKRGEEGDEDPAYRAFAEAWDDAIADGARELLQDVRRAGQDGDWRASAWLLERRHPQHYGKQVVSHELAKPDTDPDALVAEMRRIMQAGAERADEEDG